MLELAALAEGDADAEMRESVQIIGGAVQRVDDPFALALALGAAFLGQDRVIGVRAVNDAYDLGLGGAIDFGDEVIRRLVLDIEPVNLLEVPENDAGRGAGRGNANIDDRMHGAKWWDQNRGRWRITGDGRPCAWCCRIPPIRAISAVPHGR